MVTNNKYWYGIYHDIPIKIPNKNYLLISISNLRCWSPLFWKFQVWPHHWSRPSPSAKNLGPKLQFQAAPPGTMLKVFSVCIVCFYVFHVMYVFYMYYICTRLVFFVIYIYVLYMYYLLYIYKYYICILCILYVLYVIFFVLDQLFYVYDICVLFAFYLSKPFDTCI